MFGLKRKKLRNEYDDELLYSIDLAKKDWDSAKQTEQAVFEVDEELVAETQLAKAKYQFLYREAKLRNVRGHIQASVIDH
ncbi:hypothetical protein FC40_GL000993 [Ligilactobacillus hayakitensis DSM 18933 = JCM 14209]|uniref:DUF2508 domain-containing protein n=1 Tax=Ligilactobacillus hayakitensis DSM 18933 = JCM 14209 TaxID=1423755 RepID=A0A0R1WRF7_9LACO|nr:YaaL family protein [Ligilactobacillus hayakitensis]KRM18313.1 hypothetical protein FC40_GL000993 [Ligilactobacillus hayakitensis DSM 18933 = JCM 14209]